MASSLGYRDVVNAVLDAFTGGTKAKDIQFAWSAITGIPIVAEDEEVVEFIGRDSRSLAIVTDKNAYSFPLATTASVAVGDTVYAGESLVRAVEIIEFNRGEVPADLSGLVVGAGVLAAGFFAEITFDNSAKGFLGTGRLSRGRGEVLG